MIVFVRRIVVISVVACLTVLAACGSTTNPHEAAINAALRHVQGELEALSRKEHKGDFFAFYAGPPKGVSGSEWKTAVRKDRAIQRISAAMSNRSWSQTK
jgi:hypothetical protein